ncbi:hypothetical protein Clacol_003435 [Clathrus columnatus]|uniref:DM2 domain-containing protein n=1 Tax=Clathrus columnatus TaxID=1419009 RepID=A0AAV5A6W5_9AGAM|nr:hypothetical protein Clacol_003435 [Clathrus columnatus]
MPGIPFPRSMGQPRFDYVNLVRDSPPWWKAPGLVVLNVWIALLCVGICSLKDVSLTGIIASGLLHQAPMASMINGLQSVDQWKKDFNYPSGSRLGLISSIQNIGGLCAYPFAPYVADGIGRKKTILLGAFIMALGATLQTASWSINVFLGARSTYGSSHLSSSWSWRIPSALQGLPSLLQLIAVWWLPESPRYLVSRGYRPEALRTLAYYHSNGDEEHPLVEYEYEEIKAALLMERIMSAKVGWKSLFMTKGNRRRMRWSGNGLLSYYLSQVLNFIGITNSRNQLLINGCLNIFNFGCAVAAGLLCDKLGRRKLFISSTSLIHGAAIVSVVLIFCYTSGYAIAYTPLIVSYTLEILPFSLRARGFAIFNFTVSLSIIINQYINPILLEKIGWRYFIIYVCWLVFELAFVYLFIVETKDRTLEETGALFDGTDAVQDITYRAAIHAGLDMNEESNSTSHKDSEAYELHMSASRSASMTPSPTSEKRNSLQVTRKLPGNMPYVLEVQRPDEVNHFKISKLLVGHEPKTVAVSQTQYVNFIAPIKTSERRKLKQKIVETFSLSSEDGDLLVPDPILSFKFNTHVKEPGVAYTSLEGEPLWFSLGKASSELIPTVYTLWKKPNLLPVLSTPGSVIPVLLGGADLMIPGVVHKPENVKKTDLVSITADIRDPNLVGPPLAVGMMAIDSNELRGTGRGKAVNVLHVYEDSLWGMGSKLTPPEPQALEVKTDIPSQDNTSVHEESIKDEVEPDSPQDVVPEPNQQEKEYLVDAGLNNTVENPEDSLQTLTPQEVTSLLRTSTLQAIHTQLSTLSLASFPIPSSLFYSSYILPSRPVRVLKYDTPVDIKHSSHKNLTSFLKTLEKDGLIKLKDFKGDLNVLSVQASHSEVRQHEPYRTIGEKEKAEEKRATEEKIKQEKVKETLVRELWRPSASNVELFKLTGKSTTELYTSEDLRGVINQYITQHSLVNQNDQQYVNLDDTLTKAIITDGEESIQYRKRSELVKLLSQRMEVWHEITVDGKEPVVREFLSNELKKICSTSSDVTSTAKEGQIINLRGKHIQAVADLLASQGVPKRWIQASEEAKTKKK